MTLHTTRGKLPVPFITARIVWGAIYNRVVVLGPRGGGKGAPGSSSASKARKKTKQCRAATTDRVSGATRKRAAS